MTEEVPLTKPTPKHLNNWKAPGRVLSSGYEMQSDIPPEIQRNIPGNIPEEEEKKVRLNLNVNAPAFIPKIRPNESQMQNKKFNNENPNNNINNNNNQNNYQYQQKTYQGSHYNYYYNNNNNSNNNNYQKNFNNGGSYVYPMNNNYMQMNPMTFQQAAYFQQQLMHQIPNMTNPQQQYKGYNYMGNTYHNNKNYNNQKQKGNIPPPYNGMSSSQATDPAPTPLSQSMNSTKTKNSTSQSTSLNLNSEGYIPKSRRTNNNEEGKPNSNETGEYKPLNPNAKTYIPHLKEKEEKIQKQNPEKFGDEKNSELSEEKKDEQKKTKEQETKKKSKLMRLLEGDDNDSNSKKTKKEKTKKAEPEIYQKPKKPQSLADKRIESFNERDKKIKEEEKRKKEEEEKAKKIEEKKRKEEEEKNRKEEAEKKKIEEEKKKKEEEEQKKKLEMEEKNKKEEEEKRKEEEEKRKEEEEKRKEEEEKNKVIEKKYFIVFKNKKSEKKEYKYTFEYIMQFKKWKISNEDELLTDTVKQHFEDFKEEERDGGKPKKNGQKQPYYKTKNNGPKYSNIQVKEEPAPVTPTPENSMEQWARKDMTKEIKAAEEFKHKLEETIKDDPLKRNIRSFLNMLTKDNFDNTKQNIFEIIKDKVEYQEKFLDVLFQKAVSERAYVQLYAKLCKDLDKDLPQKSPPKEPKKGEKPKKSNSVMRAKLLDKCREIFQIKNNEKFDEYIKVKDPDERETKLKNFVLGNVYFITELIKIKILSKKIAPLCINNLFERYENAKGDQKLKLINIQAIVIFTDQFGTLVHNQEKKIASEDAIAFKQSIDKIFQKLDKVKDEKDLPGFVKYSIINLIEKRKDNYKMSKLEEYRIAKSKKEVEQELENQGQITQDNINDKIKRGLSDYREYVEEEGNSEKYPWKETTYLYDKHGKTLDDILEGYIVSCGDFIEKESNIKYAKDYIKELIGYYGDKIHGDEKKALKNRLFKLLDIVRDTAIDIPQIYEIYGYVIVVFLDNKIMKVDELEEIINVKDAIDEDYKIISQIFEIAYKNYKEDYFKEELANFEFVKNHSKLFEWLYKQEEEENNEEKEKNENDE